ncbi:hypothetical protein [Rhodohalobacter sulfatireducens]|uniref:LapA family protein n=1 Tax=Rhodohalobacter sulfatireducens TaxID=2911366 RepID=A0ABS9KHC5_9BACT|nr:hypothetical protein [Rhodohalobacter sulfatireducens]MCG2590258.1 hypothetical protein [Rhodohalobacter sulfatireducens]
MSPDEVVGIAIFFGSIVSIVFIIMVGSIIKTWMKRGSADKLSENQEFLEALREFKENMERRMSNLEEIVLDEKSPSASKESGKKKKQPQRAIELELEEDSQNETNSKEENSKLRNMLKQ